ncbi:MAG: hypothetical protein ACLURV_01810 [Gallintestinimicrobium sp.]
MTELEAECRHRYRVRSIREDDYGCEERPEGVWPTVLVELRMKTDNSVCSGKRITICMNSRSRRAIR